MTQQALIMGIGGKDPQVDPEAFTAPTSVVIGDVTLHAGASVWYGAVLRADSVRSSSAPTATSRTTAPSTSTPASRSRSANASRSATTPYCTARRSRTTA